VILIKPALAAFGLVKDSSSPRKQKQLREGASPKIASRMKKSKSTKRLASKRNDRLQGSTIKKPYLRHEDVIANPSSFIAGEEDKRQINSENSKYFLLRRPGGGSPILKTRNQIFQSFQEKGLVSPNNVIKAEPKHKELENLKGTNISTPSKEDTNEETLQLKKATIKKHEVGEISQCNDVMQIFSVRVTKEEIKFQPPFEISEGTSKRSTINEMRNQQGSISSFNELDFSFKCDQFVKEQEDRFDRFVKAVGKSNRIQEQNNNSFELRYKAMIKKGKMGIKLIKEGAAELLESRLKCNIELSNESSSTIKNNTHNERERDSRSRASRSIRGKVLNSFDDKWVRPEKPKHVKRPSDLESLRDLMNNISVQVCLNKSFCNKSTSAINESISERILAPVIASLDTTSFVIIDRPRVETAEKRSIECQTVKKVQQRERPNFMEPLNEGNAEYEQFSLPSSSPEYSPMFPLTPERVSLNMLSKVELISADIMDYILVDLLKDKAVIKALTLNGYMSVPLEDRMYEYLSVVFIFMNEDPEIQHYIYNKLNTPLFQRSDNEKLLAACCLDFVEPDDCLEKSIANPNRVIGEHYFRKIEAKYESTLYEENNLSPSDREVMKTIHKLIFDALNEELNKYRLHGLQGLPFTASIFYISPVDITPNRCAEILERSRSEVLTSMEFHAGVLPKTIGFGSQDEIAYFDEEEENQAKRDNAILLLMQQYVIICL